MISNLLVLLGDIFSTEPIDRTSKRNDKIAKIQKKRTIRRGRKR